MRMSCGSSCMQMIWLILLHLKRKCKSALESVDETSAEWSLEISTKKTKAMGIGCSKPF